MPNTITPEQRSEAINALRHNHPRVYRKFAEQLIDSLIAIGWGPRA